MLPVSLKVQEGWVCFSEKTRVFEEFPVHVSFRAEGNGTPLQYSCLANPMDRGAWWAAIYGVTQSQTWLKPLGSSSLGFMAPEPVIQYVPNAVSLNSKEHRTRSCIDGLLFHPRGLRTLTLGSPREMAQFSIVQCLWWLYRPEGNGNPLQRSCLENPRDREAWWAAVYGVAQSRTRLKWLSSSSLIIYLKHVNNLFCSLLWATQLNMKEIYFEQS